MLRALAKLVVAAVLIGSFVGCDEPDSGNGGGNFSRRFAQATKEPDAELRAQKFIKLALAQHKAKDSYGAEKSLTAASRACKKVTNPNGLSSIYTRLASAQAQTGDEGTAGRSLVTAHEAADKIENLETRARSLSTIADVAAYRLKQNSEAATLLKEARSWPSGSTTCNEKSACLA